jgi:hypothetical protein
VDREKTSKEELENIYNLILLSEILKSEIKTPIKNKMYFLDNSFITFET